MPTQYFYLRGIAKWTKNRQPDPKYQNFTVNLYLDTKSKEEFAKTGIQVKPKSDADGEFYTFRRPVAKVIKNELVQLGPPKSFSKDGSEYTGIIGNGSEVTVKLSVYDTVKGPGHRWESIRVENLVEYKRPDATPEASPTAPSQPAMPF